MLFCCLLIFFQNQLFEKLFQEYHLSVKQIGPDQAGHFVGPDHGPNCLHKLSADDTRSLFTVKSISLFILFPLEETNFVVC